jgi:hypothetical protein
MQRRTGIAGIKAKDGSLWFATQDGVAIIRPSGVDAVISRPSPAILESYMIDPKLVPMGRTIRMRPGQVDLEFQYTALRFVNSSALFSATNSPAWMRAGLMRTSGVLLIIRICR